MMKRYVVLLAMMIAAGCGGEVDTLNILPDDALPPIVGEDSEVPSAVETSVELLPYGEDNQGWSVVGASKRFQAVDETPCNNNGDYVWTQTDGERLSLRYDLSVVPQNEVVTGQDIVFCAARHVESPPGNAFKSEVGVRLRYGSAPEQLALPTALLDYQGTQTYNSYSAHGSMIFGRGVDTKLVATLDCMTYCGSPGAGIGARVSRMGVRVTWGPLPSSGITSTSFIQTAPGAGVRRIDFTVTAPDPAAMSYEVQRSINGSPFTGVAVTSPGSPLQSATFGETANESDVILYRVASIGFSGVARAFSPTKSTRTIIAATNFHRTTFPGCLTQFAWNDNSITNDGAVAQFSEFQNTINPGQFFDSQFTASGGTTNVLCIPTGSGAQTGRQWRIVLTRSASNAFGEARSLPSNHVGF